MSVELELQSKYVRQSFTLRIKSYFSALTVLLYTNVRSCHAHVLRLDSRQELQGMPITRDTRAPSNAKLKTVIILPWDSLLRQLWRDIFVFVTTI